ncbi:hypothetical protein RHGRI_024861 [Rhododendron griersonianum]|uniref:Ribosomal protein L33 n=1 Tax=Rhododendron griersonianum TaxID=479676 RepID=A0AAV6JB28_9ERIC|nr:hypothetical protein RHGRI_024861 [Rhododendron griersonianum]
MTFNLFPDSVFSAKRTLSFFIKKKADSSQKMEKLKGKTFFATVKERRLRKLWTLPKNNLTDYH